MQIDQIANRYFKALPKERDFYSLADLKNADLPSFLVQRIEMELKRRARRALRKPENAWVDMQSPTVIESWKQFTKAAQQDVHMPSSQVQSILKEMIAAVLRLIVKPRESIPDILFGGEERLSASELAARTDLLVVNHYVGRVLNAFMDRKNKKELHRNRCAEIIRQIDDKITAGYTPEQWAEMLNPLFVLSGSAVDTGLFCLFFEDRNMMDTARVFDGMKTEIHQAEFIDRLSSANLATRDEGEDKQTTYDWDDYKIENKDTGNKDGKKDTIANDEISKTAAAETAEVSSHGQQERVQKRPDKNIHTQFEPNDLTDDSINKENERLQENQRRSTKTHINETNDEDVISQEEASSSLNDAFSTKDENDSINKGGLQESESGEMNSENDNEFTIWKKFMDSQTKNDENIFPENTSEANSLRFGSEDLERLFSDSKKYYVNRLFNGSEENYHDSLVEIAQEDTWKGVSRLINQNIFERNEVDIYSKAAVDFTDRLQNYFADQNKT